MKHLIAIRFTHYDCAKIMNFFRCDSIYSYMFPRVFGDKFGDEFGDSLNLVINLVMNFVNQQIW